MGWRSSMMLGAVRGLVRSIRCCFMRQPPIEYLISNSTLSGASMTKTIMLSFPDEKTRDRYLQFMHDIINDIVKPESAQSNAEMVKDALNTVKFDPLVKSDTERMAAIFVSGSKIVDGNMVNMKQRFLQEIGSHSANVELKEMRDGEWKTIQARRHQLPARPQLPG